MQRSGQQFVRSAQCLVTHYLCNRIDREYHSQSETGILDRTLCVLELYLNSIKTRKRVFCFLEKTQCEKRNENHLFILIIEM